MKRLLLIVNPCSGQKKANKLLLDIVNIFNRAGYLVQTYITACAGDGERAVLQYGDQADLVVCCGGDGTFNEVLSGVLKSSRQLPVGYIPAGSTNDFAVSLGLSTKLLEAAQDIVEGTPQWLDVGCFGGRYFSYVASFGAFTRASYATPQSMKNILGHAAYVLSGIQELSQLKSYPVRVELEDGQVIEDNFIFGAVSNSTSVGGVLTLDKNRVDMADGLFEVLLVRAPKDLMALGECVRALQQKTYDCAMLTFVSSSRVTVSAPETMGWTLDGEQEAGHSQVQAECLHHAIQVIKRNPE